MSADGDILAFLEEIADEGKPEGEKVRGRYLDRIAAAYLDDLSAFEKSLRDEADWWGEKAIRGYELIRDDFDPDA